MGHCDIQNNCLIVQTTVRVLFGSLSLSLCSLSFLSRFLSEDTILNSLENQKQTTQRHTPVNVKHTLLLPSVMVVR